MHQCLSTAFLFAISFGSLLLSVASGTALHVEHLRCEQMREPQGIDLSSPRLSWQLTGEGRGQVQTAYRILVASTRELLDQYQGDLWDSGRVETDRSLLVKYQGRTLSSHQRCYWKVRVWNGQNQPSNWSKPASWLMGLLNPSDWRGQWIGLPVPERREFLSGTNWIWHPEGNPQQHAPPGERYFRREFELPADTDVERAIFRITADDRVKIFLNGRDLGSRSGFISTKELDITHRLLPGKNVIAAAAKNDGDQPNPAGLIAWAEIRYASGDQQVIVSDGDWLSSANAPEGWNQLEFDDAGWQQALVLGPVGIRPWGKVRHAENRRLPARHLRKELVFDKPIQRAVVSYSGLGISELYVNGKRIGDAVLSPAMMQYPRRLPYVTHDITDALKQGQNALGVLLGNGRFYAPRSEVYAAMPTFGPPMLNLCLTIQAADGTVAKIASDDSWRLTDQGPIVANNEYDGEEYDARKELTGWSEPEYDDSHWGQATAMEAPKGQLTYEGMQPIRVTEKLVPIKVTEPRPGVFVFDLGQNMVGWCELKVRGPAGTTVRLRHAETLNSDGTLALANIRTAQATDYYTLRGNGQEVWSPRFTYHGFRYVEVTGYPGTPIADAITGCVVHDDLKPVGEFACSNELLNQIYRNVVWGLRGNYRSVPTDCPQRDERQGWLGDRLEVARGESYVFDVAAFYAKWLQDIRDSQKPSGSLPDVAPAHWPTYSDNVVWPSASILLPEILQQQYGDNRPIAEQFDCSQRWIRYMDQYATDGLIARDSYGDWCVPPEDPWLIHTKDPARKTDTTLLASAFYAYDLDLMQRYAKQLKRQADAGWFTERADTVRTAINRRFFDAARSQYDNGTQTSCVLPLAFNLVPSQQKRGLFDGLVENVVTENDGHIATGLVGGQFLLRTLTDGGRADVAYQIATQQDYPSWGYMVSQGATTIWELWNGNTADPAMNSGNHVMLVGDLIQWLYEDLAGIAPDDNTPGFKHLVMRPQPVAGLDFVKASHRSPYGWIRSHWRKENGEFSWQLSVPTNTTAEIHLPGNDVANISESGNPLQNSAEINVKQATNGRVVVHIGSGSYDFRVTLD